MTIPHPVDRRSQSRTAARLALLAGCVLICLPLALPATSLEDVRKLVAESLKPEDTEEPDSPARAKVLRDLLKGDLGLTSGEVAELRLDLAEALVDANDPDAADKLVREIAAGAAPALRERIGLVAVAAWQKRWRRAQDPASLPAADDAVKDLGDCGPKAAARAQVAEAERLIALQAGARAARLAGDKNATGPEPAAILARIDRALVLLRDGPADERVPVYALRLLAMERGGAKPEAIQAFLAEHASDPAVQMVGETAMTGGQKLVGQKAPRLVAKRLDGKPGQIDLSGSAGKPVLVWFFTTWSDPCNQLAPNVQRLATEAPAQLQVVAVSLDNKDTVPRIPAWVERHGITFPVIGDAIGWDTDLDDAWHVDAVPALVLVAADGKVAAIDLAAPPDQVPAKVMAALGRPAAPPVTPPADVPFVP